MNVDALGCSLESVRVRTICWKDSCWFAML